MYTDCAHLPAWTRGQGNQADEEEESCLESGLKKRRDTKKHFQGAEGLPKAAGFLRSLSWSKSTEAGVHTPVNTSPKVETICLSKYLPGDIHQEENVDRERNGWRVRGARGPERWAGGGVWITGKGRRCREGRQAEMG